MVSREILLHVEGISKRYANGTEAIGSLDFDVYRGEMLSIVGPSGAGKTTLLKVISGLLPPTTGRVVFRGEEIKDKPPAGLALVFQDYSRSLFPWLTVLGNVMFPLAMRTDMPKAEKQELAERFIRAVGLSSFRSAFPWQLSGGMQQRVAIARGMASRPEILLMDEPFASVDALTRTELEDLTLRICGEFNVTALLVTHDIDEAVYLSDRVIVVTKAPARVQSVIQVPLERPRTQMETRSDPTFLEIRNHVRAMVTGTEGTTGALRLMERRAD